MAQQLLLDLFDPLPLRFDNFEVGPNAAVIAALRQLLDPQTDVERLYLYGPEQAGKTHLLFATAEAARALGWVPRYLDARTDEMVLSSNANATLWLIDHLEHASAALQQALFDWFNHAHLGADRIVFAARVPPTELGWRVDLRTRLTLAPLFAVIPLEEETLARALRQYVAQQGGTLAPEAVAFLLHHAPRRIGDLKLILDAALEEAQRLGKPISVPLVRQVWQAMNDRWGLDAAILSALDDAGSVTRHPQETPS